MTDDNTSDGGLDDTLDAIFETAVSEKLGIGEKATWVPYEGDRGGEGWKNTETGDVSYDDEPPGETLDEEEARAEAADSLAAELEANPEGEIAQEVTEVTGMDDPEAAADSFTEDAGPNELAQIITGTNGADDAEDGDRDAGWASASVQDAAAGTSAEPGAVQTAYDSNSTQDGLQTDLENAGVEPGDAEQITEELYGGEPSINNTTGDTSGDATGGVEGQPEVSPGDVIDLGGHMGEQEVQGIDPETGRPTISGGGPGNATLRGDASYEVADRADDGGPDVTDEDVDRVIDDAVENAMDAEEAGAMARDMASDMEDIDEEGVGVEARDAFRERDESGGLNEGWTDEGIPDTVTYNGEETGVVGVDKESGVVEMEGGQLAPAESVSAPADAVEPGTTFEFQGERAEVTDVDEENGTIAYEMESGEQDMTLAESVTLADLLGTDNDLGEKLDSVIDRKLETKGLGDEDFSYGLALKATWVPYTGSQGGEGWKNTETGDVVYDDEPPGESISEEEMREEAEFAIASEIRENPDGPLAEEAAELTGFGDMDDPSEAADEIAEGMTEDAGVNELGQILNQAGYGEDAGSAGPGSEGPHGSKTAAEVEEGDRMVMDGKEADVSRVSDMGGGFYIAGRTDDDEVVTARVGPGEEFELTEPDDGGDPTPDSFEDWDDIEQSDYDAMAEDFAKDRDQFRTAVEDFKDHVDDKVEAGGFGRSRRQAESAAEDALAEQFGVEGTSDEIAGELQDVSGLDLTEDIDRHGNIQGTYRARDNTQTILSYNAKKGQFHAQPDGSPDRIPDSHKYDFDSLDDAVDTMRDKAKKVSMGNKHMKDALRQASINSADIDEDLREVITTGDADSLTIDGTTWEPEFNHKGDPIWVAESGARRGASQIAREADQTDDIQVGDEETEGPVPGTELDPTDVGEEVSFTSAGAVVEGEITDVSETYDGDTKVRVQLADQPDEWPAQPFTVGEDDDVHLGGGSAEVETDSLGLALDYTDNNEFDGMGSSSELTDDGDVSLAVDHDRASSLASHASKAGEWLEMTDGDEEDAEKLKSLADKLNSQSDWDKGFPQDIEVDPTELEAFAQNATATKNYMTEREDITAGDDERKHDVTTSANAVESALGVAQAEARDGPDEKASFASELASSLADDVRAGLGLASRGDAS